MTSTELRDWMVAHRYGVRSLARALGLHPSTVQRYRDGVLPIPPVAALALRALTTTEGGQPPGA